MIFSGRGTKTKFSCLPAAPSVYDFRGSLIKFDQKYKYEMNSMKQDLNTTEIFNLLTSLEDVISSISNHNDFEELESEYLTSIAPLIPAHATALYLFDPDKTDPLRIGAQGVDLDFLSYYEKRGREVDPLRGWITSQKSPNQSQLLLGLSGWQHHPVYNIVGTASIDFAMQSPIVYGHEIIGTLNFGRDISEGPFNPADLKAISIISKFLSLAITKSIGCVETSDLRKDFCRAVEIVPQGIVITDSEYSVQYANYAAKEISVRNFGDNSPDKKLTAMLRESAPKNGQFSRMRKDNLEARITPVPGSSKKQSIVFLEEDRLRSLTGKLSGLITTREMDVLVLVDKGMRNREIADKLEISINTVKRHLDNIYFKMNVNSRTELISKVYRYLNSCSYNHSQ